MADITNETIVDFSNNVKQIASTIKNLDTKILYALSSFNNSVNESVTNYKDVDIIKGGSGGPVPAMNNGKAISIKSLKDVVKVLNSIKDVINTDNVRDIISKFAD